MRLRNVKGSKEEIENSIYTIQLPEDKKGKWNEVFKNDNPICIEIGMGKGKFLIEQAQNNPDINYIGIEKYSSVLVRALEKRKEVETDNLFLIMFDATEILNIFDKNEIDKIYLNFSDPWPKDRHSKRRLTSKEFLKKYEVILKDTGCLEFKTDNRGLFDFSLEQAELEQWEILNHTFDLHNSELVEGNVMTEYEEKFSSLGHPINKMIIKKGKK